MNLIRSLLSFLFPVWVLSGVFGCVPTSWSAGMEALRGDESAAVYFTRFNSQTLGTALVHALGTKNPSVIVHPVGTRNATQLPKWTRAWPHIQPVATADIGAITDEDVRTIDERLGGAPFELFIPEITLSEAYANPKSTGIDSLLRRAKRIHIFEEGMYTYWKFLPELAGWWAKRSDAERVAVTALFERFRRREIGRDGLPIFSLYALPAAFFYASREDLVPDELPKPTILFDGANSWRALSPADQSSVLSFFEFHPDEVHALLAASPKPNLLLLGANPHGSSYAARDYTEWLEFAARTYSGKYDLFFKPHPGDSILVEHARTIPGMQVVDTDLPFEMLEWSGIEFDKYAVAGLSSTLLHIPPGKVLHCFARKAFGDADPIAKRLLPSSAIVRKSDLKKVGED